MNFNVYVDKRTGEKLEHLAKRRGASRNREVPAFLEARGQGSAGVKYLLDTCVLSDVVRGDAGAR